ncbi:hypothetical protein H8N03_04740 [Ramlibacter sp. USB13]|uniref:Uncharacterized protein n=1 Tax=Ramlibacter cellulosilyticus TaxID=2764187 RepID=A0A923MMU7_9BURK|nr:hypothetical protein [Ramlibacter cellulosilyticus]MBC5782240.1 hypothetical protein [Ramlibacter cellulosilyticus]
MAFPSSKKTPRSRDLNRPWEAGDSIPAPEALHEDGDTGWALWHEASQQQERRFAPTAPMTQPPGMNPEEIAWAATQPAGATLLRRPLVSKAAEKPLFTLEAAMIVARRNNRVCPRPPQWDAFMKLLPPKKSLRGTQQPPAPATGAAWAITPPLTKRLCFREQIEWAERAGVLEAVMAFMQSMPEEEWLHMGED